MQRQPAPSVPLRSRRGGEAADARPDAWAGVAALLAAGSALFWLLPAAAWDWQPARAAAEPWRAVTAAFVHWSPLHLAANLLGTALAGALGVVARLPRRAALAWLAAWPLTHAALLVQPALAHYGGASGVLHAGVAVAAVHLLCSARGRRRGIAAALLGGLAIKLLLERPWGPPLRHPADWDIAIAPLAHATGAAAGAALGLLLAPWSRRG